MCCVLDSPTVSYKTFLLLRSLLHTWVDNMVFWPSQERVVRFIPDRHHEKSFLHPAVHRRYQFWSRIFVRKRNALWRTSGFTKERGKQEKMQETSPGPSDDSSSTNRNNDWWHRRAKSSPWKRRQRWNWGWLIWYSIKSDRNDKPVFLPMVFSNPIFNSQAFISDCHGLLQDNEDQTDSKTQISKAKIITAVLRKTFSQLSLTKQQMDVLNRVVKAIILFITQEMRILTDHIHAVYLSCVRDCARIVVGRQTSFEESFNSCEYFALAFDTALFGLEHVLSCIVRFTFKDKVSQHTLFLSTCSSSTGRELAVFIFNKLRTKNVPFNKLSCVTSDGAANMFGSMSGMIAHLRRLIAEECGIENSILEPVWCLSHRLNLVIRDFQQVEYIKSVFQFCDWFTARRRVVSYKKWLQRAYPNDCFRTIPKPSQTRWSFYYEALEVLLSQIEQVERFLRKDRDFAQFKTANWPCENGISDVSQAFFGEQFVLAHFQFALFVLETINSTNTKLQQQFVFIPQAWILILQPQANFSSTFWWIADINVYILWLSYGFKSRTACPFRWSSRDCCSTWRSVFLAPVFQ